LVKNGGFYSDKYIYLGTNMANQAEIQSRIDSLEAQIAETNSQLAQLRNAGDDPQAIADLEAYLNTLTDQLFAAQAELQNIATVDTNNDPYVNAGNTTTPTIKEQQTIPNYQYPQSPYGTPPYDDAGNLQPGWELNENNDPVWVGFPDNKLNTDANQTRSLQGQKQGANQGSANQNIGNLALGKDWRVRLSLAPSAKYLYNSSNPGILAPLKETHGVIFPYTPTIQVSYNASYDPFEPTHSNYKIYQYKNSSVGEITINADFTAQDTKEGAYMLAVIHFFRSVTKMFYGQDGQNGEGPRNGTPPPLCYLSGFGSYNFDNHPLVVTNFSFTYPNDVDYIRVGPPGQTGGLSDAAFKYTVDKWIPGLSRLLSSGLKPGAINSDPVFQTKTTTDPTYVPTKLQLAISCSPIVTRKDISDNFSVASYGTGKLLQGSKNGRGGIW
jgi:uncharacterized coiled-coil protein SlyX